MSKYYLLLAFVFTGCAGITVNGTMCEEIASQPNSTLPKECRNYVKEDAQKATDKYKKEFESKKEDLVEFNKNNKEKK